MRFLVDAQLPRLLAICDNSTLSALAEMGLLDLLPLVIGRITVPATPSPIYWIGPPNSDECFSALKSVSSNPNVTS